MASETFVFHSDINGDEKTITAEPSPTYTLISKDKFKEEKKPVSVFTLRHTIDGQLEFTSNRKIIRVNIDSSYTPEPIPTEWSCSTTIQADVILSFRDMIKHKLWGRKKDKTEKDKTDNDKTENDKTEKDVEAPVKENKSV